ncbi:MAG: ion transporter [Treponemataceae bacterium]|nr:ion transporter [Treponemataceae bacterium]
MNATSQTMSEKLKRFVDGDADTIYEYVLLFIIIINTITIGLETVNDIAATYGKTLFLIDQFCFWVFVIDLIIKSIAYNKQFIGEFRLDEEGNRYFHLNKWNVFDLLIVIISGIGSLPFFAVFRVWRLFKSVKIVKGIKSFRVIKTFKLVNGINQLRVILKAVIKAIPSVLWTFCLLLIFAYVYAIVGISLFCSDFPLWFGDLGVAFLSLFKMTSIDASEIIARFNFAWMYFVTYDFFEASIIMNVIVGVIVNSVNASRAEVELEDSGITPVTLESISKQIEILQKKMEEISGR